MNNFGLFQTIAEHIETVSGINTKISDLMKAAGNDEEKALTFIVNHYVQVCGTYNTTPRNIKGAEKMIADRVELLNNVAEYA